MTERDQLSRRLELLELRVTRLEPPATRELSDEERARWVDQVDRAVSRYRSRRRSMCSLNLLPGEPVDYAIRVYSAPELADLELPEPAEQIVGPTSAARW